MAIEVEKFPDLLSASWGARKDSGTRRDSLRAKGLRIWGGSQCLKPWSETKSLGSRSTGIQRQKKTEVPAQAEGVNSSYLHHFACSIQPPAPNWMVPTSLARKFFFTQSTDSNGNLFQRHPHRFT